MSLSIHPFPARMAPELALSALKSTKGYVRVLDPMSGSGTVVGYSAMLGHEAFGCDLDPLAILMARVSTTPVRPEEIRKAYSEVVRVALSLNPETISLSWIDDDDETRNFVQFWFGEKQRRVLRCLSAVLMNPENYCKIEIPLPILDILKISVSRMIITKEQKASLARDTSHSRPHKVASKSDFDVFRGFEISVDQVARRLANLKIKGVAKIASGDARSLHFPDNYFDAVVTSPPYLNAIDYMRGHRLALVWFGYRVNELRKIRSTSIGAEKAPDAGDIFVAKIVTSFGDISSLMSRQVRMIERYAIDLERALSEAGRVLKPGGKAVYVVGNSCLKGNFISNSNAVRTAGELAGLRLDDEVERELPVNRRYLPMKTQSALQKRMRTESVLTFSKA